MRKGVKHIYISRFIIEAETALSTSSGEETMVRDQLILKDMNGFPFISGESITGVLRSLLKEHIDIISLFGSKSDQDDGEGSNIKLSHAHMILNNSKDKFEISDTLISDKKYKTLKSKFKHLPLRTHTAINHRGAADKEKRALYDNEVVYKGTQFIFELSLELKEQKDEDWNRIRSAVYSELFRLGGNTRSGLGKLKVIKEWSKCYNLSNEVLFNEYCELDARLTSVSLNDFANEIPSEPDNLNYTSYKLDLKPQNHFIFGGSSGYEDADRESIREEIINYYNGDIEFKQSYVIPGSSVKGGLAHRFAYYSNKSNKFFADKFKSIDEFKKYANKRNDSVIKLFGTEKSKETGQQGRVIIDDIYIDIAHIETQRANHVAIDRFTGGALEGRLFDEVVIKSKIIQLNILVLESQENNNLKQAIQDIENGMLPLGGMTTKGYGFFFKMQ